MNEKIHEGYVPTERQKEPDVTRSNTNFKSKLKVGATLLGLLVATSSCDTVTETRDKLWGITPAQRNLKKEIKNLKKEQRIQEDLRETRHKLKIKIEERKGWVEKYNDKLDECKKYPNDYQKKERALVVLNYLVKCNNEILSCENKDYKKTQELYDIRSISSNELPTGKIYTDPDYFNDLLKDNQEDNTANYFDFNNENNGNNGKDHKNEEHSKRYKRDDEPTLQELVND